jgi:hypothetical protein
MIEIVQTNAVELFKQARLWYKCGSLGLRRLKDLENDIGEVKTMRGLRQKTNNG